MADDQEKTEEVYTLIRHRNKVAMTTLTLGSIQHRAHGTLCLCQFF